MITGRREKARQGGKGQIEEDGTKKTRPVASSKLAVVDVVFLEVSVVQRSFSFHVSSFHRCSRRSFADSYVNSRVRLNSTLMDRELSGLGMKFLVRSRRDLWQIIK